MFLIFNFIPTITWTPIENAETKGEKIWKITTQTPPLPLSTTVELCLLYTFLIWTRFQKRVYLQFIKRVCNQKSFLASMCFRQLILPLQYKIQCVPRKGTWNTSDQLFINLYTIYEYLSLCTQIADPKYSEAFSWHTLYNNES